LNGEIQARQAEEDQQAVASFAGQIKALIQSVWRFPPSAKHDQVVLLRIFMVPTGEVTDVQLVESSGNTALDRSAEQAVWRVAKFPVPEDASLFEKQFRNFLIQLKPENARL
jgi:colicin import membrane protein